MPTPPVDEREARGNPRHARAPPGARPGAVCRRVSPRRGSLASGGDHVLQRGPRLQLGGRLRGIRLEHERGARAVSEELTARCEGAARDPLVPHGGRRERATGQRPLCSAQVGIKSGQDRYTMALAVAHELGHVLGLDHEQRLCATMNPVMVNYRPSRCPAVPAGRWVCRLLRADDVRGAVMLYGGTVRRPRGPQFCARA